MENTKVAILVLAIAAALIVAASGAYAMGMQATRTNSYQGTSYGPGTGQGMMGGFNGYQGGMMGGYGTMGSGCGSSSMHQYMSQYWNSTTTAP